MLPENKDGHHLEIFAEKKSGESGFTCFEKFSFVGFGLKERRSPPKDGHYLQKKASPMTGPWGGLTVKEVVNIMFIRHVEVKGVLKN